MNRTFRLTTSTLLVALCLAACTRNNPAEVSEGPRWLAGDHHIHSRYSVGYNRETNPPTPIVGGDAIYPIPMNVLMGRYFGLSWTVATDHGGPNHSKVNSEQAYPELLRARAALPEMIQFYGMELNAPGADHASLILPKTGDESDRLLDLESRFDKHERWPSDPARDDPGRMLAALEAMNQYRPKPVVIANHPSRSATGLGQYGLDDPAELRDWNNQAPDVAVGMAGAPGHQAAALSRREAPRGGYGRYPTLGGFDQMTARLGGFWDAMLGEGRRWWITANSDSHVHYTEGGIDFWPGEYSKTWVYAEKDYESILESLRRGRIFVATGDLISELALTVSTDDASADIGEELKVREARTITVTVRLRDPAGVNHNNQNPDVSRVDLIVGEVYGPAADPDLDTNSSTRVLQRFDSGNWKRAGEYLSMSTTLLVTHPLYLRVRGTNTDQLEPEVDTPAEDPWNDLWFYSNPVFVSTDF